MAERRLKKRGKPAACPFCEQQIPRPGPIEQPYCGCSGGSCSCGAIFLLDATGREGGTAMLEGLLLLAGGDSKQAMALQGGTDYQVKGLSYDPRMHVLTPMLHGRTFGQPKLWFFKRENPGNPA